MSIGAIALVSCAGTAPVTPRATVYFLLDAPLCSSIVPAQFTVDGVQVGIDTFFVHIAGREHERSRG